MNTTRKFLLAAVFSTATIAISPPSLAAQNEMAVAAGNAGNKTVRALGNIASAPLEIPKNMINISNDTNIFFGIIGGAISGVLNMVGRISTGVTDLATVPLNTRPIATPVYVWDDFDIDTSYGPAFRLQNTSGQYDNSSSYHEQNMAPTNYPASNAGSNPAMQLNQDQQSAVDAALASAAAANKRALAAEQAANRAVRSAQQANQKLDNMFKKSMAK